MQQEMQKIPFCLIIWFIIAVVYIIIFQIWRWLVLVRLFNSTTVICYVNHTDNTGRTENRDSSFHPDPILSGAFVMCGCVTVIQFCWISIISFHKKRFDTIQGKNRKLGIQVTELQRALNVNIGSPNNALPPYTALPNEREQLLTRSQLPNYQSVET